MVSLKIGNVSRETLPFRLLFLENNSLIMPYPKILLGFFNSGICTIPIKNTRLAPILFECEHDVILFHVEQPPLSKTLMTVFVAPS